MTELDVAVNLLWLAPGRVGGSEQYLVRQLAGLPPDSGIAPRLMCQRAFVTAHPELAGAVPDRGRCRSTADWRGARIVAEHTWLAARSRSADVVHHGGGTVPIAGPRPILLTIHDLQYLAYPDYFSTARRDVPALDGAALGQRRAAVVAVPSAFVRETVIDAFGVAADRVVVVPHGVPGCDGRRRRARSRPSASASDSAPGPYLVYPAITHPHKGHAALIEMMAALDGDLALVLDRRHRRRRSRGDVGGPRSRPRRPGRAHRVACPTPIGTR